MDAVRPNQEAAHLFQRPWISLGLRVRRAHFELPRNNSFEAGTKRLLAC
jgi:hypothetical protein